jgi:quercetin dioxygenase-like cupin family protein
MRATSVAGTFALALLVAGRPTAAGEPTNPAAAVLKDHIMVAAGEVRWGACPAKFPPGAQCATIEGDPKAENVLFTTRVRIPDGYRIAPHYHPADEHLTVLSGTFRMGLGEKFDDALLTSLGAGSFAVMPKGARHFATARGETVVQVHAIGPWNLTYVDPKDDPSRK